MELGQDWAGLVGSAHGCRIAGKFGAAGFWKKNRKSGARTRKKCKLGVQGSQRAWLLVVEFWGRVSEP